MTSMADQADTRPRDRVADALTAVVAGSSAFSSWTGWVLLGHYAGWPKQGLPFGAEFDTAWLNPISVDVLAYLGMRAWVSPHSSPTAKSWGRGAALGALGLSIVGNALGHTLGGPHGKDQPDPGQILLSVGLAAMAPVILVVVLHLRTLRSVGIQPTPVTHPEMDPTEETDGSASHPEVDEKPQVAPIPRPIPQAAQVAAAAIPREQVHVPISGSTDLWTTDEARTREMAKATPKPEPKQDQAKPQEPAKPKAGAKEARPEDIAAAQKLIKAGALTESPTADQIKAALRISLAYARPVRDHLQALQEASQQDTEEAEGNHS